MTASTPERHSLPTDSILYSAIVPVYNEKDSLPELYAQLTETLTALGAPYEILFVDDGSNDGSTAYLEQLAEKDNHTRFISFYSNYGKSAAYTAGFRASRGNILFTLDSDLQDVPSEMPRLLETLHKGYDLVIGWKQKRLQHEPIKKIPSFVYNSLKYFLFGIRLHDSNSGFRCMRRDVAMSLHLYGDRYRFIPEFSHLRGFKVAEIATEHRQRKFGKTKYGGSRFLTGLMDLLSVRYLSHYSAKPLHFFGTLAFLMIVLGGGLEFYVLLQKLMGSSFQQHVAAIILGALLIIVGFLFLSIGLLGEMLSAYRQDSHYAIRSQTGFRNGE